MGAMIPELRVVEGERRPPWAEAAMIERNERAGRVFRPAAGDGEAPLPLERNSDILSFGDESRQV